MVAVLVRMLRRWALSAAAGGVASRRTRGMIGPQSMARMTAAAPSSEDLDTFLDRLAEVERQRMDEATARAAAEVRLSELDDLRTQLDEARRELRILRERLARMLEESSRA